MLRFNKIVFGPIHSRRLGSSLGVNLLPLNGKLCNFDCVYCECGWNRDGRCSGTLPAAEEVAGELERVLMSCREDGTAIDSITFSGNGEPTLHPEFPLIIDRTLEIRDRLCPEAKVSVLSNASRLDHLEVLAALKKVDNPILKLDAVSREGAQLVNRPGFDWELDDIVKGMRSFDGNFILPTMFLSSDFFDSSSILERWMELVRELRPRKVMAYSLDRETPMSGLRPYSAARMEEMLSPLIREGFDIQINA